MCVAHYNAARKEKRAARDRRPNVSAHLVGVTPICARYIYANVNCSLRARSVNARAGARVMRMMGIIQ